MGISHKLLRKALMPMAFVMIEQTSQKVFIAASVFRVGTNISAPADNFRLHGLSVAVDPITGQLGGGAMTPTDGTVTWHGAHPDNGVQKKGISYVGWDVFLTDQGMSLLEGNRWLGVSLHQVHHALLADSKVRKIYQDFNVVR